MQVRQIEPDRVQLAYMQPSDAPALAAIDAVSFPWPWHAEDFLRVIRDPDTICFAGRDSARDDSRIIGYCIARIMPLSFRIYSLAVDPLYRRMGVGGILLEQMKQRCRNGGKRSRLTLEVAESNLPAHLFLRACGVKALGAADTLYVNERGETVESYLFEWRVSK